MIEVKLLKVAIVNILLLFRSLVQIEKRQSTLHIDGTTTRGLISSNWISELKMNSFVEATISKKEHDNLASL